MKVSVNDQDKYIPVLEVVILQRQVGRCFVVFYGREFNLKSLSVVALSETECDYWIKGLACLIQVHNHS